MINEQQQTIRFRVPDPDELSVNELKAIKTGLDEVKAILYVTMQHLKEQKPKWYQFWKFKKYNDGPRASGSSNQPRENIFVLKSDSTVEF